MTDEICIYNPLPCLHPCTKCEWYIARIDQCAIPYNKICPHLTCKNNPNNNGSFE